MCIVGPSGSGKTSYLCSFAIKQSPFDEEWKHKELSVETLEMFEELCEESIEEAEEDEEKPFNLLILDDSFNSF
jgi:ABC-type lipoprotein export system ATPase subunit